MYFQYGQEETEYLSGKDEKLGAVIAQVGRVNREVDTDLFSAVVHHIVGQQISTKALLEQGKMNVKVLKTNDTWYGMTYHEDVAAVRESFKEMLENGVYKADLFGDL